MSYLLIDKLEKSYGAHPILKGITLSIGKGELVSLLGPSGSGKTTILRCIAGLEMPDAKSGELRLGDVTLSGAGRFVRPEHRELGMVFQNYAVWPHMTVFENVAFPLRLRGENATLESRTKEALDLVKLNGMEKRYSHELSGGQQQRVALARALVMSPRALLLDEPLSNLDALLREELGAEIRILQQRLGLTTILVTHDQKEALSLSDRIVVLNRGEVEAVGAPEELYAKPPSRFVAEFISGAQEVAGGKGEKRVFIPRRWRRTDAASSEYGRFRVISRIFLGSEYEYRVQSEKLSEPIRFFSKDRLEAGDEISLAYAGGDA